MSRELIDSCSDAFGDSIFCGLFRLYWLSRLNGLSWYTLALCFGWWRNKWSESWCLDWNLTWSLGWCRCWCWRRCRCFNWSLNWSFLHNWLSNFLISLSNQLFWLYFTSWSLLSWLSRLCWWLWLSLWFWLSMLENDRLLILIWSCITNKLLDHFRSCNGLLNLE